MKEIKTEKPKSIEEELKVLKTKAQENKAVIGFEEVCKGLKNHSLEKVYLAKNCELRMKEDVHYYARLAQIPVMELELTNEELGILCKKGFLIAVMGI